MEKVQELPDGALILIFSNTRYKFLLERGQMLVKALYFLTRTYTIIYVMYHHGQKHFTNHLFLEHQK